jgi:hypothetical protein
MSRPGLPRWAALAALPVLVGAVLLMHGLDARAGGSVTPVSPVAERHETGHDHDHDRGCDSCPGPHHLLAACLAVVATIGTCRAARHLTTRVRSAIAAARHDASRVGAVLNELVRPPDPAWVRLSVMRC